ncbi:MAG: SelL-related redox protein [Planctomycetota bacterium]
MTLALRLAGMYNVLWGGLTVLYPNWLFDLTGMAPPSYPFIWQCVGMIVGVYGLGYWVAAKDPARHWPIVAVGLLGKLFGPAGYVQGVVVGDLGLPFTSDVPVEFGLTLLTNDLVWWVPFTLILIHALRVNTRGDEAEALPVADAMAAATASDGTTVLDHSNASPVMLLFLRHTGCTFCKEALADLASKKAELDSAGVKPVLVHMSPPADFDGVLERYGLSGTPHVSDPAKQLYRSFELRRGTLGELMPLSAWGRGFFATLRGHTVGKLVGDGFQMPGAFIVENGSVVREYRHKTSADRPDYARLACPA